MTVASSGDRSRGGRTAGGVDEEASAGAAGRPSTRAPPVKSGTATASARPAISSLEALRVRVVKKVGEKSDDGGDGGGGRSSDEDGDDEDDDGDSFEVDLKLEAYDAEVRRRSADAAAAPRPGAVESRSSSVSAGTRPPSRLRPPSAAAETAPGALTTATAGASHEGGSRAGGLPRTGAGPAAVAASVEEEKAPSEPAVSGTAAPGDPASSVATTHDRGANGGGSRGRGFLERGGSGLLWRSASGTGGARGKAGGGMHQVAEEDEDMSLTIGTGSGRPMVPVMTAGGAGSGGNLRGLSQGGENSASRNGTGVAAQNPGGTPAATALPVGEESPWSTCGSSSSRGPGVFSAEGGGLKGDLTPQVGSERTDKSDRGGGGAGSEGLGDGASSSSGLLGIGGRGCSFDKPGKVVAFDHSSVSHKRSWSEVMVNGVLYLKTAQIGRGGSSKVFRVVAPDCEMLALKVVKVDNHAENAKALLDSYSNEIELLKSLQGNRFIINLENSEVDRRRGLIYIVLELGETDLDQLMRQYKANIASSRADPKALGLFPGGLDANFVRVIWQQMLKAVQAMHEQRVVHGDLKPANFVFVKGSLKLIDFGIAKAISNDTTNISRDSRVGTMNYMCPEAFEDTGNGELDPATGSQKPVIKQGRPSDIWSLGCILYQMAHGKTPFSHLGMLNKIRAITDPNHAIAFSDLEDGFLVETLRACLRRDPAERASIGGADGLLSHPYLHPTAARASLEGTLNAKLDAANALSVRANALTARANARAADLEKTLETKAGERVEGVKRELSARYEELVAAEVTKAVAEEQAKQMAGLSIAKSALKHIIANTVRVLHAEKYSGGSSLDRANLDRITGLVIDLGRGGGGGIQAPGTRQ
ncbi:possibly a dual-specificity PK? [Ectocarpus siliculosus]|uniref:Possibly a dual-specificity PK n=1 Tax=Ectocarpus siliculosus TaxID=2880 RepID=D7G1H4_ECTSI|nr:possibly a dual-specificity PK? [Ectocarpus siliculosus]|eukprot:CBJ26782.1 possibly a dual-specificity PK? [Ectocarpus siliculosus]